MQQLSLFCNFYTAVIRCSISKAGFPLVEKRAEDRKTGNSGAAICRPAALFVRTWRAPSRVAFYPIK